jgi:hypothetical protein
LAKSKIFRCAAEQNAINFSRKFENGNKMQLVWALLLANFKHFRCASEQHTIDLSRLKAARLQSAVNFFAARNFTCCLLVRKFQTFWLRGRSRTKGNQFVCISPRKILEVWIVFCVTVLFSRAVNIFGISTRCQFQLPCSQFPKGFWYGRTKCVQFFFSHALRAREYLMLVYVIVAATILITQKSQIKMFWQISIKRQRGTL